MVFLQGFFFFNDSWVVSFLNVIKRSQCYIVSTMNCKLEFALKIRKQNSLSVTELHLKEKKITNVDKRLFLMRLGFKRGGLISLGIGYFEGLNH